MRKLRSNEINSYKKWCSFCYPLKTLAIWIGESDSGSACEVHKSKLEKKEKHCLYCDANPSEADYQSWGKL